MKRYLSMLLALLMVFNLTITAFAAEGDSNTFSLKADKTTVNVGDTVYITVSADSAYTGMSGMTFFVYFDDTVFEATKATVMYENGLAGKTFDYNVRTDLGDDRCAYVTFMDFSATSALTAGDYFVLQFTAIAASEGSQFYMTTPEVIDGTYVQVTYPVYVGDPVTVAVTEPASAEGYTVSASEDKTITAGETAQVQVAVSNDDASVYNAYDLTLTYDTEKLTYVSGTAADADAVVTEENGTIRVIGYGADKALDTPAVTLNFTGNAIGDADVVISSAKVDIGNHAISDDAPEATILDDTTVITITGYTVSLGDGLSGESVVAPGADYTFTAVDADNYDYEITATMGGETVIPTDNGDGTYTIENVTGNLVITAVITAKSYDVTVDGTGKDDVTAADKATYNTDYTFKVNEDSAYTYSVSVKIGEDGYSLGTPVDGVYTITGTAITGDITITVTKEAKPADTVNVTKPDYVEGDDTATKGEDYDFSIDEEDGYEYSDPTVKVDGTDITDKIVENDDGSYTIPGEYVTGDITIEVERTDAITVDVVEYITLDEQSMYLVTVSGTIAEGSIAKYDGMSMYWSEEYDAYAWLVISADGLDAVKAAAAEKVTIAEGAAAGTVDYTGDVNGTGVIDVNDAQLTYDMYNAAYTLDDVAMLKFLNADVNADKTVNVNDAAAIVAAIQ